MRKSLPTQGTDWNTLSEQLDSFSADDVDWRRSRSAVFVFHAGDDVLDVGKQAYAKYQSENGLGAGSAFPSLARMESDVVDIGLELLSAPEGACGNMTSGGSESIFLALKTCRDQARALGRDTRNAQIVLPRSGHPAFDKAAGYLDLEVVRIPVADDWRADIEATRAAVNDRTLMLVGSAPCFPYGLIDPIEELAELAADKNVWLHVDACVGGYFSPFARRNGVELPEFDFSLEPVRSMSADLHKYGYAAKGASTIFHRTPEQHEFQFFTCDQWPVGTMRTPSAAGTRPGGAIAAAWAVLHYLGGDGYCRKASEVVETRRLIERAVSTLPSVFVIGKPKLGLIAIGSDKLDIYAVQEQLSTRGWFNPLLDEPEAIHLMLSPQHRLVVADYVADLKAAVQIVEQGGLRSSATARYN